MKSTKTKIDDGKTIQDVIDVCQSFKTGSGQNNLEERLKKRLRNDTGGNNVHTTIQQFNASTGPDGGAAARRVRNRDENSVPATLLPEGSVPSGQSTGNLNDVEAVVEQFNANAGGGSRSMSKSEFIQFFYDGDMSELLENSDESNGRLDNKDGDSNFIMSELLQKSGRDFDFIMSDLLGNSDESNGTRDNVPGNSHGDSHVNAAGASNIVDKTLRQFNALNGTRDDAADDSNTKDTVMQQHNAADDSDGDQDLWGGFEYMLYDNT